MVHFRGILGGPFGGPLVVHPGIEACVKRVVQGKFCSGPHTVKTNLTKGTGYTRESLGTLKINVNLL